MLKLREHLSKIAIELRRLPHTTVLPFLHQRLSDLGRQLAYGEWLLDETHILIQYAVMSNGIGRMARHEHPFKLRVNGQQSLRQNVAVHPGHHHVGQEQMDLAVAFPGQTDSFTRVFAATTV